MKDARDKTSRSQNITNNNNDVYEQLAKLSSLRDNGIITVEEFNEKKAELLSRI